MFRGLQFNITGFIQFEMTLKNIEDNFKNPWPASGFPRLSMSEDACESY